MEQHLLRFFKTEEYQNQFLDGKLRMNTLKSFKDTEKFDIARADKFEAIFEHKQQNIDDIQTILLWPHKEEILSSSITKTTEKFDFCNLLCLYALWKKTEDEQIVIDEKNKFFGQYCVCITDIQEFLIRIKKITDEKDIVCHHMQVEYINKSQEHTIVEEKIPFTKFDNFAYQREFRIAIDTKKNVDEVYILEIGNLRDIAFITTIDKINAQLLLVSDSACGNE